MLHANGAASYTANNGILCWHALQDMICSEVADGWKAVAAVLGLLPQAGIVAW